MTDTDPTMQRQLTSIDLQSRKAKFRSLNEAEIPSYVKHINTYLREDQFLKNYLPLQVDPTGTQLFDLIRDGVLLCKLINLAVPGTIDEKAIIINKKRSLNLWERNINHTLCLNSAKAIGCTVVNIGAQDLEEGRPHLVLGLLSQIIKIHLMKPLLHERKDIDESDSREKMKDGDSQKVVWSSNVIISDEDMGDACALDQNLPKTLQHERKDTDEFDSWQKMKEGDSQKVDCSSDLVIEAGYSDEDMGDADSDIIYSEGFRISDEMESEDDEEESDDDEQELDDDDEFEALNYIQSLEAGEAEEKMPETRGIVDILDDGYELQVESGFVTRWALLNPSYMRSRRFLAKLRYKCLSLGMEKFAAWPIKEFRGSIDLVAIEKLLDKLEIELVLLIPRCPGYNDVKIEKMCEKLGIAYQNLDIAYYSCFPKGPLKSVARKIQYKVVKRMVRLRRLELPLVRDAPMIIFGADMVQGLGCEHIASVSVSVDWPKFRKYLGLLSYQQYNEGIIEDLYVMITHYFNSFQKKNKERPKKLIFFRNGLEEGDFDHICQQEINAIERACASNCKFTYVVVVHVIGPKPRSATFDYRFFCRHSTENTNNEVCYCVVRDDNHFPPGELQALTSQLCTFRHRRKNPYMDSVVPAYYACQQVLDELEEVKNRLAQRKQKMGDENDYSS